MDCCAFRVAELGVSSMSAKRPLWITLLVFVEIAILSQSCMNKKPNKPNAANAALNEFVSPLEAVKFDAEKQNQIFRDLVSQSQGDNCQENSPKATVRLLTASEYVQTVESAFEIDMDDQVIKQSLPTETVGVLGYDHLRQFNVISAERLSSYMNANTQIAKIVKDRKADVLNCGRSAVTCVEEWLTARLPRLWRKKVDAADISLLAASLNDYGTDANGLGMLVERLLLSPNFLFRQQLGLTGNLSSWEVASIMADSLWNQAPSNELVDLANRDGLNSKAAVRQQVKAMIDDARFLDGLKHFTSYWLTTGVLDRKNFAQAGNSVITDAVKASMKDESATFLLSLVRSNQDQFAHIFDAPYTTGNQAYASVFGLTASTDVIPGLPSGVSKLNFPADRRGLISQPGIVAIASNLSSTNIPLRGKNVMEKFLCQTLETPPNLATVVANTKFDTTVSVHDAFEKATMSGSCGNCHKLVNGIGYGLENIGPDGRVQQNDGHGFPVTQAAGSIFMAGAGQVETPATFTGAAGLGQILASSKESELCLTVQVFRLVYARLEESRDVCTIANAYKNASQSGLELDTLLTEMIVKRSQLAE